MCVCMCVCVCDYIRRLECDVEIMRFDALISYIYAMLACPFDTCFHRQSFLFFIIYFAFFSFSSIISFIFLFFISPPFGGPRRNNELIHSVNRNSVFTIILRNTIFLFTFNKVCSLLLYLAWNPITLCKTSPTDNQTEDETEKNTHSTTDKLSLVHHTKQTEGIY